MRISSQQGYRDGYSKVDKRGYFGKIALRTIEDTLARIYEEKILPCSIRIIPFRSGHRTIGWTGRIRDSLLKFRN